MLSREDFYMIKQMRQQGAYIVDIATQIGCSERTIRRYLKYPEPPARKTRHKMVKLKPFMDYIDMRLAENVWNSEVIFAEIKAMGYTGGRSMLRYYIQPKRKMRPSKRTVRFETQPGYQLQHDWGEVEVEVAGQRCKVNFAVNTLGFSRRFHVFAAPKQDAEHTYESLVRAFRYFGGCVKTVLVDNQKAAVLKNNNGKVVFNSGFLLLADHYNFLPRACRPRRARTKGKVERMVKYLKENFFVRYYNWVQHEPSDRKQSDERLKLEIKVAHIRTRETYGTRRLQTELAENGIIVGRDRLARLRKELRLRCKQKRKFRATTNSNHNLSVAPNLLNQTFAPTAPNQVWVADLTYVATQEGWLYLAGIKDVYTCEIVGYAMGERMTKELTGKALFMALRSQRPPAGLIHHSDRGSQYCAYDYRVIQEQFGLKTSMSRKGNCYDNAPMESFWGTLKNESLSHYRFNNRDEAISVIREYIEIFYNRQRRHSRLGNISPAAFREKYHQMAA